MNKLTKKRSPFWALFWAIAKGEMRDSMNSLTSDGKKRRGFLSKGLNQVGRLVLYLLLIVGGGFFFFYQGMMLGGTQLSYEALFQTVATVLFIFNILFGIFSVVSMLYYVKDIELYLTLPFRPEEIVRAKFIHYMVMSMMGNLIFLATLFGAFYVRKAPIMLYIGGGLGFFFAGISIDLIITILVVLLMMFSKFARNKDRFNTVMQTVIVVVAIALGIGVQFLVHDESGQVVSGLVQSQGLHIANIITSIFCFPLFISSWFFAENIALLLAALGLMILLSLIYMLILDKLTQRYYLPSVMRIQGSGAEKSRKVYSKREWDEKMRPRTFRKAFAFVDWKKVRRTPVFFTQFILSPLMMPIYFLGIGLVIIFLQDGLRALPLIQIFARMITFDSLPSIWILLGVFFYAVINSLSNFTAQLSISRDGEDFYFYRALPISWRDYLLVKFRGSYLLSVLPVLLIALVIFIVVQLPILLGLYYLLVYVLSSVSGFLFALAMAAFKPKLDWETETQLTKSGKNALYVYLNMILMAVLLAPIFLLMYIGFRMEEVPTLFMHGFSVIYLIVLNIGLWCYVFRHVSKKLETKEYR